MAEHPSQSSSGDAEIDASRTTPVAEAAGKGIGVPTATDEATHQATAGVLPVPASRNALVGIGLKVASALCFSVMLALVKLTSEAIPVGEVVFARNFFGILPVIAIVWAQGRLATALRTAHPWGHAKRAFAGVIAMSCWFFALRTLPLPEATAIVFAAPLILVVLAVLLLKERVRIYRWSAVIVGLVGVVVILIPQMRAAEAGDDLALFGALMALVAAVFMALASVFVRQLTGTEPTMTIVLYFFIAASVLSLLTLPFGWVVPSPRDAAILVTIGVLGGFGQILLTQAYRYAEASVIAPFEYTSMIWAVAIGWFVFAEVPLTTTLAGSAVLIASGLFVIYRERQLGLKRADQTLGRFTK